MLTYLICGILIIVAFFIGYGLGVDHEYDRMKRSMDETAALYKDKCKKSEIIADILQSQVDEWKRMYLDKK